MYGDYSHPSTFMPAYEHQQQHQHAHPPHLAPEQAGYASAYAAAVPSLGLSMGSNIGESSSAAVFNDDSQQQVHLQGSPKTKEEALAAGDDDGGKRRRVQRACDVCRRKKIRCDGMQPGKSACTNCITYGHECKFEEAAKRRAPPRAYVEALEARMERMEQLLVDLAPGVDFTERVGPPVRLPDENAAANNNIANGPGNAAGPANGKDKAGMSPPATFKALPSSSLRRNELAHSVLPDDPAERQRFIDDIGGKPAVKQEESDDEGEQSYHDEEIALVQTANKHNDLSRIKIMLQGRQDVARTPADSPETSLSPPDEAAAAAAAPSLGGSETVPKEPITFLGNSSTIHLVHGLEKMGGQGEIMKCMVDSMRPEYWKNSTTILEDLIDPERDAAELDAILALWPAPDLEKMLIEVYFSRAHHDTPILDENAFRAELKDESFRKDRESVMAAMVVFAIGSRLIDDGDERVMCPPKGDDAKVNTIGAGFYNAWKRLAFGTRPPSGSLRYIQSLILSVVWLSGTGLHFDIGWCLLGVAFRLLEFAGAHRKLTAERLQHPLPLAEEWRRTWWTAYSLDREMSTTLGRPMAVQDEDFDVSLPLEVDEKYIAASTGSSSSSGGTSTPPLPTQPKGKPAAISGFLSGLKLDEIMGRTLRTIYAIGKAKVSKGLVGKGWDQLIVAEIDSLLNQWLDSVPKHLRYNANEKNQEWLIQSSMLYCKYYFAQVIVHRPFIVGPKMSSSLNYPSLAITTNAAKSMAQILGNLLKRGLTHHGGHWVASRAFEAGCVLLVVVWGSKRNGMRVPSSTVGDINKCLEILREHEKRWPMAGRLTDLLSTLCRIFNVETEAKQPDPAMLSKRKASAPDDGEEGASAAAASTSAAAPADRPVRGHSRVDNSSSGTSSASARKSGHLSRSASGHLDHLPLSTQDLGISPASDSSGSGGQMSSLASPRNVHAQPPSQLQHQAYAQQQVPPYPQACAQQHQQQQQQHQHVDSHNPFASGGSSGLTSNSNVDAYSDLAAAAAAAAAGGPSSSSSDFDMSALMAGSGDLFANFVNGLSAPTFTPLDLPSFSSAFFTQPPSGVTPGASGAGGVRRGSAMFAAGAGGFPGGGAAGAAGSSLTGDLGGGIGAGAAGGQSQLTPGYSSIFGSGVDYATFQPTVPPHSTGEGQTSSMAAVAASMAPSSSSMMAMDSSAPVGAGAGDPFNMRDLWPSQEYGHHQ